MTARWKTGLWLGKAWNSDEHLIAGEHGTVVVARSVYKLKMNFVSDDGDSMREQIIEDACA